MLAHRTRVHTRPANFGKSKLSTTYVNIITGKSLVEQASHDTPRCKIMTASTSLTALTAVIFALIKAFFELRHQLQEHVKESGNHSTKWLASIWCKCLHGRHTSVEGLLVGGAPPGHAHAHPEAPPHQSPCVGVPLGLAVTPLQQSLRPVHLQ